jgi:hypothetical protein
VTLQTVTGVLSGEALTFKKLGSSFSSSDPKKGRFIGDIVVRIKAIGLLGDSIKKGFPINIRYIKK